MFIYHSKSDAVRVTVVGVLVDDNLLLSVARCSEKDTFRKRTKIIPSKKSFTVRTSDGPKIVPSRPPQVLEGGIDLALERINNGCVYISYPISDCSVKQFNTIAKGIVYEVTDNPVLVENCKKTS